MPEPQLARGTGRAVVWLARQVELVLQERDLTLAQYRVLAQLEERAALASVLARRLAVTKPSITTVVEGLVQRGLIERADDPQDRRRIQHSLTRNGRQALARADSAIETGMQAVLSHLDARGAQDIASGLVSLLELTERIAASEPAAEL